MLPIAALIGVMLGFFRLMGAVLVIMGAEALGGRKCRLGIVVFIFAAIGFCRSFEPKPSADFICEAEVLALRMTSGGFCGRIISIDPDSQVLSHEDMAGEKIAVSGKAARICQPGDIVKVRGRVFFAACYEPFWSRQGVFYVMKAKKACVIGSSGGLPGRFWAARRKISGRLERLFTREDAARVRAVMLGETWQLDKEELENFRRSGSAHLLAVSGFHIGISFGCAAWILGICGLPRRKKIMLASMAAFGYAAAACFSPSSLRAAFMISLGVCAACFGRKVMAVQTIGWAAAFMLAYDPYLAAGAGFQLSFAAVLGLCMWVPAVLTHIRRHRMPEFICLPFTVSAIAFIHTAPLAVAHFGILAPAGIFSGIVMSPMVLALFPASVLAVLAEPFGIGWLPAFIGTLCCRGISFAAAHIALHAPYWQDLRLSSGSVICYYITCAFLRMALHVYDAHKRNASAEKCLYNLRARDRQFLPGCSVQAS